MQALQKLINQKDCSIDTRTLKKKEIFFDLGSTKKKYGKYFYQALNKKPSAIITEKAKILFVGLAPAAHGGTRTGRVFTGDASSTFLFQCLYKAKLCNQPTSVARTDGLKLYHSYITTALKCVPPQDKPTITELNNCSSYFQKEISYLTNLKMIIALGKIAFDACIKFYKNKYDLSQQKFTFVHGKQYILPDGKILLGCYHPSPRNVNTGRINLIKMTKVFIAAKQTLKIN